MFQGLGSKSASTASRNASPQTRWLSAIWCVRTVQLAAARAREAKAGQQGERERISALERLGGDSLAGKGTGEAANIKSPSLVSSHTIKQYEYADNWVRMLQNEKPCGTE